LTGALQPAARAHQRGINPACPKQENQMPFHYNPNQPRVPAGQHEGGEWTSEGDGEQSTSQPAFFDRSREASRKAIEAVLAFFAWLSARNSDDQQAIISFNAREFKLDKVELLTRDEVNKACERLGQVQELTDRATAAAVALGFMSPSQRGTEIHFRVKQDVDALHDPNFRAEVSYLKTRSETSDPPEASYGDKGSIRVDVLENKGDGTVCVYDLKTDRSRLSLARMAEITAAVFKSFDYVDRIIVTEVRPSR
jgi:ATP-dependent exoDNAse (exonuclease V) beta subunit